MYALIACVSVVHGFRNWFVYSVASSSDIAWCLSRELNWFHKREMVWDHEYSLRMICSYLSNVKPLNVNLKNLSLSETSIYRISTLFQNISCASPSCYGENIYGFTRRWCTNVESTSGHRDGFYCGCDIDIISEKLPIFGDTLESPKAFIGFCIWISWNCNVFW